MHVDSLLCYAMYHSGCREIVLRPPCRVFHIDHETRSDGAAAYRSGNTNGSDVPVITGEQFDKWACQIREERCPVPFNDEDWGLGGMCLPEHSGT